MTLHNCASVLHLSEANVTTWLFVVAGHRHMSVFRVWVPCHPPTATPQPPQGAWVCHLKVTQKGKHSPEDSPCFLTCMAGMGEMLGWGCPFPQPQQLSASLSRGSSLKSSCGLIPFYKTYSIWKTQALS